MKSILHWLRGTRIVASWIAAGAPTVSQQQAEARASVCLQCPKNQRSRGLGMVGNLVMIVANYRSTKMVPNRLDAGLKVCAVCSCPLPHKTRMPIEDVVQGIDLKNGELLKFPLPCWIRTELIK